MNHDDDLDFYKQQIRDLQYFSQEEEIEYFKRYYNGEDVLETIFINYLPLVIKIAKDYYKYIEKNSLSVMDLIQHGNLGLLKAIENYNLSSEKRFTTYATFWIKQYILRAIQNETRVIRFPSYLLDSYKRYSSEYNRLSKLLKREPTIEELSNSLKFSIKMIKKIQIYDKMRLGESLDKLEFDKEDNHYLIGEKSESLEDEVINKLYEKEKKNVIYKLLNNVKLTDVQYKILVDRYGLAGHNRMTQKEIAEKYGVCKQYVSNVEKMALKKIRKSIYIDQLLLYREDPEYSKKTLEELIKKERKC